MPQFFAGHDRVARVPFYRTAPEDREYGPAETDGHPFHMAESCSAVEEEGNTVNGRRAPEASCVNTLRGTLSTHLGAPIFEPMTTLKTAPDDDVSRVRAQFGPSADAYATSEVHARGESLTVLLDLLGFAADLSPAATAVPEPVPGPEAAERPATARAAASRQPSAAPGRAMNALDIATGAGHTAIALAPHVQRVVATDVTEQMLAKTRELAAAAGRANVETEAARAEELPYPDGEFDLVTCRLAFHHFEDQRQAAREMARVLRLGGRLGFTDNLTVQDPAAAAYYNAYEALRDPSHNRVLSLSQLVGMLEDAGLVVQKMHRLSKEFEFHVWADRQRVSEADKERLLAMMREIPQALESLFAPRWTDGTMYFSLWEAVIVAVRV